MRWCLQLDYLSAFSEKYLKPLPVFTSVFGFLKKLGCIKSVISSLTLDRGFGHNLVTIAGGGEMGTLYCPLLPLFSSPPPFPTRSFYFIFFSFFCVSVTSRKFWIIRHLFYIDYRIEYIAFYSNRPHCVGNHQNSCFNFEIKWIKGQSWMANSIFEIKNESKKPSI